MGATPNCVLNPSPHGQKPNFSKLVILLENFIILMQRRKLLTLFIKCIECSSIASVHYAESSDRSWRRKSQNKPYTISSGQHTSRHINLASMVPTVLWIKRGLCSAVFYYRLTMKRSELSQACLDIKR